MTALALFLHLTAAGCQLSRVENRLRVHDPQHSLTDALRQHIRQHKEESTTTRRAGGLRIPP